VNEEGGVEYMEWSSDSKRILFTISVRSAVWVVDADGSNLRHFTPINSQIFFMSWSPDCTTIAFTRSGGEIALMNSDGTNERALSPSSPVKGIPHWAPDGTEIAYGGYGGSFGDVLVTSLDGTTTRTIAHGSRLITYFRRS
jgi:Tol biopolymer transport system component